DDHVYLGCCIPSAAMISARTLTWDGALSINHRKRSKSARPWIGVWTPSTKNFLAALHKDKECPAMSVTSDSQTLFLPQILERRAEDCRDGWSFTFLDSKGTEQCRWSAQDLVLRARAVAARLNATTRPGEPVLLVFQAGPEFLAAFMGCLWSGR